MTVTFQTPKQQQRTVTKGLPLREIVEKYQHPVSMDNYGERAIARQTRRTHYWNFQWIITHLATLAKVWNGSAKVT